MTKSMVQLSEGSLLALFGKAKTIQEGQPLTLQITNLKVIPTEQGNRARCILLDGEYTVNGVMNISCYDSAQLQGVQKSSIVKLLNYTSQKMSNKRVIIIDELQVLEPTAARCTDKSTPIIDQYFASHPEEDGLGVSDFELTPNGGSVVAATTSATAPTIKKKETRANLYAIDQLSPYQNNWTIKARVSYKSDVRTWSNQRGEGKLFNVNFLDETNEIRATGFNDVADKFYDLLTEGKVYYVSKARIQQSKPQFSGLAHPYELQFDRDTEIEECEDASDVPKLNFNFVKLNKIQDLDANSVVDVVGVLKEVNPLFQLVAKATGRPFDRRDITVVDESQFAVNVGLWNKAALDFNLPVGSIIAVKGAKVQDFGGRSLSLTQSATVVPNPDIPELFQLKGWYDKQGINEQFKSLKVESSGPGTGGAMNIRERKTIAEAQNENLGMNDKADFFSIKAHVSFVRTETWSYPACPSEGCNKKVIEQPDGTWRCEKDDKNFEAPKHRFVTSITVMDHTGQLWLTVFNDEMEKMLDGVTANEIFNSGKPGAHYFQRLQQREFNFRVRAKQENYNGNVRIRYSVAGVQNIDYNEEVNHLSEKLTSLLP